MLEASLRCRMPPPIEKNADIDVALPMRPSGDLASEQVCRNDTGMSLRNRLPQLGLEAVALHGTSIAARRQGSGYYQEASVVYLVPRGSAGRLPTQWDANLTLSYPIAVGPATVTLQAYLFRIFNNQIATTRDNRWTTSLPNGYPATIYDTAQPSDNPEYGKFTSRQAPRFFRAAVRVSF